MVEDVSFVSRKGERNGRLGKVGLYIIYTEDIEWRVDRHLYYYKNSPNFRFFFEKCLTSYLFRSNKLLRLS